MNSGPITLIAFSICAYFTVNTTALQVNDTKNKNTNMHAIIPTNVRFFEEYLPLNIFAEFIKTKITKKTIPTAINMHVIQFACS